jgi:hypothetical protein
MALPRVTMSNEPHECVCIVGQTKRNKRKCKHCYPVKVLQHQLYKKIRDAVRFIGMDLSASNNIDYENLFGCSREIFEEIYLAKIDAWNVKYSSFMGSLSHENSQADHICPFATVFELPSITLQLQATHLLCHITNLQPMPAQFNQIKSNHWCPTDKQFWRAHIWNNFDFLEIYWPCCVVSAGKCTALKYLNTTSKK